VRHGLDHAAMIQRLEVDALDRARDEFLLERHAEQLLVDGFAPDAAKRLGIGDRVAA
jgi:hypothetical protein